MERRFGIIFDMDGVLVDSNPFHKKALKHFARSHGFELTEKALREKIYGRQNKDWIPSLFGKTLSQEQLEAYGEEKELHFQRLFDKSIEPVRGLVNFLDELRRDNVSRAIATSAPRMNVDFVFRKTSIGDYFGLVLDESHIKRGKPDPEIYLKACDLIGFDPGHCVVFEDSIAGVASAQAAGCKVVAVLTTHTKEEFEGVDLAITDFTEVTLDDIAELFKK